jgi:hypothetical protein
LNLSSALQRHFAQLSAVALLQNPLKKASATGA